MGDEVADQDYNIVVKVSSGQAQAALRSTQTSFTELNQALELANKGFQAFSTVAGKGLEALSKGAEIRGISDAFKTLQQSVGQYAGESLEKARSATKGLASDLDLMREANQAAQLGLDPARFYELAEGAIILGQAVGRGPVESIQDLVTGLGRQSVLMLDNLGIIIKTSEAYDKWARANGVLVSEMTEAQKKIAFQEAGFDAVAEKVEKLGGVQLNAGLATKQLESAFRNLYNEFAEGLTQSEVLKEALSEFSEVVNEIDLKQLGKDVANTSALLLEKLGPSVVKLTGWFHDFTVGLEIFIKRWDVAVGHFNVGLSNFEKGLPRLKELLDFNPILPGIGTVQEKLVDLAGVAGDYTLELLGLGDASETAATQVVKLASATETQTSTNQESVKSNTTLNNTFKETSKVTEKQRKQISKLKDEWAKLTRETRINSLKDALNDAIEAADHVQFRKIRHELETAITDAAKESFKKYSSIIPKSDIDSAIAKEVGDGLKDADTEFQNKLKDNFQESANFFTDALYNAMTGAAFDAEDIMKRVLAGVAGGFLADLTGGFGGGQGDFNLQNLGQQLGASILGGGSNPFISDATASANDILGSYQAALGISGGAEATGILATLGSAAPFAAVPAATFIGQNSISGLGNLFSGDKLSNSELAALGVSTFGFGLAANEISGLFGGKGDPDEKARRAFRQRIEEISTFGESGGYNPYSFGSLTGSGSLHTGSDVDFGSSLAGGTVGLLQGIGLAFGGGGKGGEDATGIFSNAVLEGAENYEETLANIVSLMSALNVSVESGKDLLKEQFLLGQLSLEEFGIGIQSFNELAQAEFEGVSNAVQLFANTMEGDARQSILVFEAVMGAAAKEGIETFSGLSNYVLDEFGPEVSKEFQEIADAGVDSFSQLNQDSADHLYLISETAQSIAQAMAQSMKQAVSEMGVEMARGAERSKNALNDVGRRADEVGRKVANIGRSTSSLQSGNPRS